MSRKRPRPNERFNFDQSYAPNDYGAARGDSSYGNLQGYSQDVHEKPRRSLDYRQQSDHSSYSDRSLDYGDGRYSDRSLGRYEAHASGENYYRYDDGYSNQDGYSNFSGPPSLSLPYTSEYYDRYPYMPYSSYENGLSTAEIARESYSYNLPQPSHQNSDRYSADYRNYSNAVHENSYVFNTSNDGSDRYAYDGREYPMHRNYQGTHPNRLSYYDSTVQLNPDRILKPFPNSSLDQRQDSFSSASKVNNDRSSDANRAARNKSMIDSIMAARELKSKTKPKSKLKASSPLKDSDDMDNDIQPQISDNSQTKQIVTKVNNDCQMEEAAEADTKRTELKDPDIRNRLIFDKDFDVYVISYSLMALGLRPKIIEQIKKADEGKVKVPKPVVLSSADVDMEIDTPEVISKKNTNEIGKKTIPNDKSISNPTDRELQSTGDKSIVRSVSMNSGNVEYQNQSVVRPLLNRSVSVQETPTLKSPIATKAISKPPPPPERPPPPPPPPPPPANYPYSIHNTPDDYWRWNYDHAYYANQDQPWYFSRYGPQRSSSSHYSNNNMAKRTQSKPPPPRDPRP